MAIARTVRANCPGIVPDEGMLEATRERLHVVEADHAVFAPQAHAAAETLKQALAEAPNKQAWCDAVYRLYGPRGTMMRGMLRPSDSR